MKKSKLVFIVDNDATLLDAISQYMGREFESYQVMTFRTEKECLERLVLMPNIIILDYPKDSVDEQAMNSLELLKAIKKVSKKSKVIFFTKENSTELAKICLNSGIADWVIKDDTSEIHLLLGLKNIGRKLNAIEEEKKSILSTYYALGIVFGIALMYFIVWALFLSKTT